MDTVQTPNVALLRQTLAHIEAHPKTWHQRHYRCGTGMDFAAWAAQLDGGQWCTDDPDADGSHLLTDRGDDPHEHVWGGTVSAYARASRVLGLDRTQARRLFHPDNTLDDLRLIVGELCATAEGVVPADAPTDLDLALEALADKVADFAAAAERCDLPEVDRASLATEHRVRADAVMDGLVAALKATAGPAGDVYGLSPRDAASALVGAATRKRGGAVSQ